MHARRFRPVWLVGLGLLLAAASPAPAADSYQVDPVHSSIHFRVKHLGLGYVYGRFNDFSGSFTFDDRDPSQGKLEMQVKVETIDTNNKLRDTHLKGADFFNAAKYPTMAFKSTRIKAAGTNVYEVTGNLTLLGVTKPVTVKLERIGSGKDQRGGVRTGWESTFTVKRSDFGMKNMLEAIGDEVRVILAVEGLKN
jgi:polyisoprenoid-binding protein YceI